MDELSTFFLVFGGIMVFILIFFVVMLIAQGYPLYKMAKNKGLENAWLAFVPIGNTYIMLNIPDHKFNLFNIYVESDRKKLFLVYLLFSLATGVVGSIPIIGWILSICAVVISIAASYQFLKDILDTYMDKDTTLFAVLSLFIPFMQIVLLYVCMNKPRLYVQNTVIQDGFNFNNFNNNNDNIL